MWALQRENYVRNVKFLKYCITIKQTAFLNHSVKRQWEKLSLYPRYSFFFFVVFLLFLWAAPVAFGGSPARG